MKHPCTACSTLESANTLIPVPCCRATHKEDAECARFEFMCQPCLDALLLMWPSPFRYIRDRELCGAYAARSFVPLKKVRRPPGLLNERRAGSSIEPY